MKSAMRRSRVVYALPLSLLMSGEVLAADQEEKPGMTHSQQIPAAVQKPGKGATPATKVEHLEVHGRRASTIASSATKSNTPLIETAQSVSVITRNEMDIRGVLDLNQAGRYIAGVTPNLRGGVGTRPFLMA